LNAAIESAPPISSKLIRRSTDGRFGREYHQREGEFIYYRNSYGQFD
jgi:hypothetical protein